MLACSMRSLFVSAWKREIHRSFADLMQNTLKIQTDMNFWIARYHHCGREKGGNFCMLEVIFFSPSQHMLSILAETTRRSRFYSVADFWKAPVCLSWSGSMLTKQGNKNSLPVFRHLKDLYRATRLLWTRSNSQNWAYGHEVRFLLLSANP